jgi:hypothetical protein
MLVVLRIDLAHRVGHPAAVGRDLGVTHFPESLQIVEGDGATGLLRREGGGREEENERQSTTHADSREVDR